ncbi:Pycsar system effector family protein [Siphonobacter sp. SORGH_AS_1065]|uniref:Pycsar system effector family protein n=1 Tax=Siphonobacter sp. SORGH_AS_1065 TaxID=3041795 RepID=UPI00277F7FFF|nr:Pycsar system effector family protein [Siphonobacter sp. SORGH_AS_1065]MDQ1090351.1 putative metal-dependent HD superfamily phosphohydrolase [Siphonobacter sp. SORGH_AS_1065]
MMELDLSQVEAHVVQTYQDRVVPELVYHTLTHTREVVAAVHTLSQHYQLSTEPYQIVMAAAWFHDLGYLYGSAAEHEQKSAELAADYLNKKGFSDSFIAQVRACILATRMPQKPNTLLEEIICDADLCHLASADYKEKSKLLRQEVELLKGYTLSGADWRTANILFFQNHQYFTHYARSIYQSGKTANLERLLEKQDKKEQTEVPEKKKKKDNPERGIETMFRTTSSNHLRLSEIADSKANIMISVNSIMVSVVVSVLSHRLENHPSLIPPTALFLSTAVLTIIFSVLATRPNVTQGTFSREDIEQQKANLLFFGNFYNMSLKDYEHGISAMMHNSDFLYGSMTRDIYYLGVVLGKKYKLLRIAYNIFMFGFVASILAYLYVFLFIDEA